MKAAIALVCLILVLALPSCGRSPDTALPEVTSSPYPVFTYNIDDYGDLYSLFEENGAIFPESGRYTLKLDGFSTDVTLEMDGLIVLSAGAYGKSLELMIYEFEGEINADISEYSGAIIINDCEDHRGSTRIITETDVIELHPEGDMSTQVYVSDGGELKYRHFFGHYYTSFEQWDTAPIDICHSRDQLIFEGGYAEIKDGKVSFDAEQTLLLSDLYDLDAMFEEAKAAGMYSEYDTVDQLLEANKSRGEQDQKAIK